MERTGAKFRGGVPRRARSPGRLSFLQGALSFSGPNPQPGWDLAELAFSLKEQMRVHVHLSPTEMHAT